jgi:hypothetical protein
MLLMVNVRQSLSLGACLLQSGGDCLMNSLRVVETIRFVRIMLDLNCWFVRIRVLVNP